MTWPQRARRPLGGALVAAPLLVILAACDPSPAAVSPTATTPTADVRVSAADAYITAVTARNARDAAVSASTCAAAVTPPQLKSCWQQRDDVLKVFVVALAHITFPDNMKGDVIGLRTAADRLERAMAGLAAAPDPAADHSDQGVESAESAYVLAASVTVRTDLGILATPQPTVSP